jgi:hypothetical protein
MPGYITCITKHLLMYAGARKKGDIRYTRVCPVPGCRSKPQKKLSQHLKYKHPGLPSNVRKHYLKVAQRVEKPKSKVDGKQPTLVQVLSSSKDCLQDTEAEVGDESRVAEMDDENLVVEEVDDESRMVNEDEADEYLEVSADENACGTRLFPRFDVENPVFYRFEQYLMSIDGGEKNEKSSREISIDVSKYLRYACGSSAPKPDWSRLVDRDQLLGYTEKLKRAKVGPEGRLAKLDYFQAAIRFLKYHVVDENHPLHRKLTLADGMLSEWKKTLRREKRRLRKVRLEKLSAEQLSLDETTALLDHKPLWKDFNNTWVRCDRGESVPVRSLDQAAVVLAGSLLYKNWQRPGAIVNATLEEFENATCMTDKSLYIMHVEEHKTAMEGVAKVVMDTVDHERVFHYVATVRKAQIGEGSTDPKTLFVLCGGRGIKSLSSRLKVVDGLQLPNATRVRKIGATTVAMKYGQTPEASLVTRQMSHSLHTEAMYYQAIVGDNHAARAYSTMKQLQQETPSKQGDSSDTSRGICTPQ